MLLWLTENKYLSLAYVNILVNCMPTSTASAEGIFLSKCFSDFGVKQELTQEESIDANSEEPEHITLPAGT